MQPAKSSKPVEESIRDMLNKTGVFLERKVLSSLIASHFAVRREEPYQLITASGEQTGTIDILAASPAGAGFVLCLCIECKRANVEQKHWVIEREEPKDYNAQYQQETHHFVYYNGERNSPESPKSIIYGVDVQFRNLGYQSWDHLDRAIVAFEFNDTNGALSKNSEEKAFNAIQQAQRAMAGISPSGGVDNLKTMLSTSDSPNVLFIPLVVTTANLWVLDYAAGDVSWMNGTLDISRLSLQPKNWIHYLFPLPLSLQIRSAGRTPNKRPTFIVNAQHFEEFVQKLLKDCVGTSFARH